MIVKKEDIIKLPGLVDVHVHLREPGATYKEDFESGTRAAVAGGYTQILDMPNNVNPTTTPARLQEKIRVSKGKIWCDLGFNFGATVDSTRYFPKVYKKTFGLKIYMSQTTGPLLVNKLQEQDLIFKSWLSNLPTMVHAEDELVEVAIRLAKKYKRKIHICHMTANQLKLWMNLSEIDMISTDHAPHTLEEKYDQSSPKFGVPGLETTLPLMLEAVARGKISIGRLVEMTSTNPRKIFHLPAQPNTFMTVNLEERYKISKKGLFTKCGWTPFVGLEGRGEIKKVVLRGQIIFENGRFSGKPQGKVIYPD